MDSKLVVTLANALPQLVDISVLLMPTAAVLSRLPLPNNGNLGVNVVQFQGEQLMSPIRYCCQLSLDSTHPVGTAAV